MAGKFVRASKFRHVFGKEHKKEDCYDDIKVTKTSWDSPFCAVNPKFLAIVIESSGGAFIVIPLEKHGRVDAGYPRVGGHTESIMDIQWNPFNDNIIASASEDTTIKIWLIPDGGLASDLNNSIVDLCYHQKKVGLIRWHPAAENIIASAGHDHVVIVWNIETASPITLIEGCHQDLVWSMQWNYIGDKIVTSCKDKKIRVLDARSGKVDVEKQCHEGSKPQQASFCGKLPYVITTGFTRMSTRQYGLWNLDDLSQLALEEIDNNNSTLFIYYDEDINMFYLAGKGDSAIRYYEVTSEEPYVYWLAMYQSNQPQKGVGFMPKRGCDANINEVQRLYKLHNTSHLCEPISFTVPRKSDLFQEDIFPLTRGDDPSMTIAEWVDGKNTEPKLISLKDGFKSKKKGSGPGIKIKLPTKSAGGQEMSADELIATVKALKEQVAVLEKKVADLEAK